MKTLQKKGLLLICILMLALSVIGLMIIPGLGNKLFISANAEIINDEEDFTFTLATNEDGESCYKIALRPVMRPYAEVVVIPETYNNLPVTEIATGGFMSCVNLTRVFLSKNIETVGNNAFINCVNLQYVGLPNVETIGANAFAMCTALERLYIPSTVQSVGANILRNNENAIYVQSSEQEVELLWDSTWNSYYTGEIYYDSEIGDTIEYTEILDETQTQVIGYEIGNYQTMQNIYGDVVIYNTYRPNETSEYLPVLNIKPEAFSNSILNKLTFKDRHADDPTVEENAIPINLRSQVFSLAVINEISFEVAITMNHPAGLDAGTSLFDGSAFVGDANGNSIRMFENASIVSITLPADLQVIPEKTFLNCAFLQNIKLYGEEYTGENILPEVSYIGDSAFSSCGALSNLTIPETVVEMGEGVFYEWGQAGIEQSIQVNRYEDEIPEGWSDNWLGGYQGHPDEISENLTINYKQKIEVTIYMEDGTGDSFSVLVKPDYDMPSIEEELDRNGYIFKGIFSGQDGTGIQYYTSGLQSARQWSETDTPILYVDWDLIEYSIDYSTDLKGSVNSNPVKYTVEDEFTFIELSARGYDFEWNPAGIVKGTTGDITVMGVWTTINYRIFYDVDWKGLDNPYPDTYTVIDDEIVFEPLQKDGYTFQWNIDSIPTGSIGDVRVVGEWELIHYNIYYLGLVEGAVHNNPATYTVEDTIVFSNATRGGYTIVWDRNGIVEGTTGNITVHAINTEKTLVQCYNNGVYEIWTFNQLIQLHDQPNGGNGRTYRVMNNIRCPLTNYHWIAIPEFKGTLDGNGYLISNFELDESSGGNIGLVGINSGTIKKLTIATKYDVSTDYSNVNVGSFAGINKGTITECATETLFNRYIFTCYAAGVSYAGGFVGINEGTISSCTGGDSMIGSCNMGTIAGKNAGTISNCHGGNGVTQIDYLYRSYNASVGGIVGLQTAGKVENCSFQGRIVWSSVYYSENYDSWYEDREMQPCIGIMIGYKQGGSITGSSWELGSGQFGDMVGAIVDPVVVTWTTGALFWEEEHEHDQGLYFKNEECGRID